MWLRCLTYLRRALARSRDLVVACRSQHLAELPPLLLSTASPPAARTAAATERVRAICDAAGRRACGSRCRRGHARPARCIRQQLAYSRRQRFDFPAGPPRHRAVVKLCGRSADAPAAARERRAVAFILQNLEGAQACALVRTVGQRLHFVTRRGAICCVSQSSHCQAHDGRYPS